MAVKYFQLRLEPEEYKALQERWEAAGFSGVQDAGLAALRNADWGDKTGQESAIPGKLRPYMKKLAQVLASGNEKAITAVTSNIDVFLEYVHAVARPIQEKH